MVFTFIALWTITIILIINGSKKDSMIWGALITFFGGCGAFARAMIESFLPYLQKYELVLPSAEAWFYNIYSIGSFMNTNGLPYAFFMFTFCYSGYFNKKTKTIAAFLSVLPVIVMYFITPFNPTIIHDYKILSIWVGPYILAGSILLIHSYYKEKNPFLKRSRKFLLYMALPPVLFQLFSNYILRMLDVQEAWRFNAVMICILFVIFIVFLTKYDVFGIKVKFEKQRLDSTIRALTSGTTLVNHSIKNEVGKMNLLAVQLQYKANEKQLPDLLEDIDNILISTDHLLGMANRVQHHMRDIILKEDFYNLHLIIEESLELINPYIKKQNIQVLKDYPFQADLLCDKVLIQEMFSNLFTNSIEAMKENGRLEIQLYDTKKNIVISVKDNGSGISKENLPHVMDPFFSTKRRSNNFGLGLSYCYNVIQKHHGNLELYSDVNVGTTIMIHYPKKKVKSLIAYSKEVGIGGKDQSLVS